MPFGDRYHSGGTAAAARGPRKKGGFGSAYASVPVQAPRAKKKSRHGLGGLVENLGSDIASSVAGIPAGIVHTVEHPVRTGQQIAKSYKQTYGPLAHGDVSKFLHNLYSHPLGPILDALTVATLGAGGTAKAGQILAEARVVSPASRIARLGERRAITYHAPRGEADVTKLTHTNPLIRARQATIKKMLDRLPYETPHVGEAARYAREAQRLPRQAAMRLTRSKEATAYRQATKHLSKEEFAAVHLVGNDLHPLDYLDALKKLRDDGEHVDPVMFKVLENPKVNEAFDKIMAGDKHLTRAVDAADALSKLDARVKIEHGILNEDTAAARVGKHRPAVEELLGSMRETPGRPFYVPDVPVARRVANAELQRLGGGAGVARNIVKENRGVLFRTGQLALTPDLLGPEFLRTIKYGLVDDLHATLMAGAARVSAEEARAGMIPKNWTLIPKEIISKTGSKRPQTIHPLVRGKAEALRATESVLPPEEHLGESFTVRDLNDAATLHGDYLIVPESLKKTMVGEFNRSTSAVRQFIDKPTKVWRALVLGFRVGFLTNNVVGNHLLYALNAAGVDGLRAYLNAVKRAHGDSMVKRLLTDREIPEPLRADFMREFFPEQIEGTFGKTQAPGLEESALKRRTQGKRGRQVGRLATGLLPATQAIAEGNLRRALVETMIRKSPEFKQMYRSMSRDTRTFETAAEKILRGEGGHAYQRMISDRVNNVLGDYLNLSPFERNVLRGVFPFYGWYRAITRITTHLALDTPGRANLLQKVGQVGADETVRELGQIPDYLKGLLPIGTEHGGKHTVLSTQGLNPFATLTQLGTGVSGVLTGKPGDTGRAFTELGPNPLMLAAIENLAGKNLFSGRAIQGGPGGIPGAVVRNVFAQLPQTRLVSRPESKLYGRPSQREAILAYLGVPVKELNLQRAHGYARR